MTRPIVLFVCKSNAGKSQMAEGLLRHRVGEAAEIHSAGTNPGSGINEESAASLDELGAVVHVGTPKGVDPELLRRADRVVVVGTAAKLEPIDGMRASIEVWATDEPSLRGIEGADRMRLIRNDIDARVATLAAELGLDKVAAVPQAPSVTGASSPAGFGALPNVLDLDGGNCCGAGGC